MRPVDVAGIAAVALVVCVAVWATAVLTQQALIP